MLDQDFFHLSLKIFAWNHDAVRTTFTFYPDVHSHPNDLPAICPAWMRLFHFNHVIQAKFFVGQARSPLCFLYRDLIVQKTTWKEQLFNKKLFIYYIPIKYKKYYVFHLLNNG